MLENEFVSRMNHAKMLIRAGQVREALEEVDLAAAEAGEHFDRFSSGARYLIPFCRGRAYVQVKQPDLAIGELEAALEIAGEDAEAKVRTLNLLGLVHFELGQPVAALDCHFVCLYTISNGEIYDLNLKLSVYQNLANTYWALNDLQNAIGIYKKALGVLEDLDAPERQAEIYWGLGLAYKAQQNWRYARLSILRAIRTYKRTGNEMAEAAMHLNLAELLIESESAGASHVLAEALELLGRAPNHGLLSYAYRYIAELDRKAGRIADAIEHGNQSLHHAELLSAGQDSGSPLWLDPVRTHAEALASTALVYEAGGDSIRADRLFEEAFHKLEGSTLKETLHMLHFTFASICEARGNYEQAMVHFRFAAKEK